MGKLHKIKRAFSRLDHDRKIKMHKSNQRFYIRQYGAVYDGGWRFQYACPSYGAFVTQLVNDYYNKHIKQEKHVVERSYLNKEP